MKLREIHKPSLRGIVETEQTREVAICEIQMLARGESQELFVEALTAIVWDTSVAHLASA